MLKMDGYFELRVAKTGSVLNGSLTNNTEKNLSVPVLSFRLKRNDGRLREEAPPTDSASLAKTDHTTSVNTEKPLAGPINTLVRDSIRTTHQVISTKTNTAGNTVSKTITAEPPVPASIELFKARKKDYAKIIEVENSSIRLEVYDNGSIDYDSVSLFLNDELVLPKTMLTHKSVKLTLHLNMDLEYNELGMFAENLGMIPPNTAALIIRDGLKNYEVNLNSDFNKNAIIQLKTKKQVSK